MLSEAERNLNPLPRFTLQLITTYKQTKKKTLTFLSGISLGTLTTHKFRPLVLQLEANTEEKKTNNNKTKQTLKTKKNGYFLGWSEILQFSCGGYKHICENTKMDILIFTEFKILGAKSRASHMIGKHLQGFISSPWIVFISFYRVIQGKMRYWCLFFFWDGSSL